MRVTKYGEDSFELVLPDDESGADTITSRSNAWKPFCDDLRLRGALALLYHRVPESRAWQDELIASGTKVFFGELSTTTYGEYSARLHAITANNLLRDDYSSVVATLLAHEIVHARKRTFYPNTRQAAGEWFAEEIEAFHITANVWKQLKTGHEQSPAAKWHETVLTYAAEKRLPELVLLSKAYQEQIFGIEIVSQPEVPQPQSLESAQETTTRAGAITSLVLGVQHGGEQIIALSDDDRVRHTLIVGKSGTGKSNLMLNAMLQDARAGRGFTLIDPFGNLSEDLLCRLPRDRVADVVLLDLSDKENPFGLNLFDTRGMTDEDDIDSRVGAVAEVFRRVWDSQQAITMETWAKIIARTFMEAGEGTLVESLDLLTNPTYRQRFLKQLTHRFSRYYWEEHTDRNGKPKGEEIGAFIRRLGLFLDNSTLTNIVGQQESTVDFDSWMALEKIVICKLPLTVGEQIVPLLGMILMQRIIKAAMRRKVRKPYYLYADEFHYFATTDMLQVINGMRQFGLGLTVATQQLMYTR